MTEPATSWFGYEEDVASGWFSIIMSYKSASLQYQ